MNFTCPVQSFQLVMGCCQGFDACIFDEEEFLEQPLESLCVSG